MSQSRPPGRLTGKQYSAKLQPSFNHWTNSVKDVDTSKATSEAQPATDSAHAHIPEPGILRASTRLTPSELESLREEFKRDSLWLKNELARLKG